MRTVLILLVLVLSITCVAMAAKKKKAEVKRETAKTEVVQNTKSYKNFKNVSFSKEHEELIKKVYLYSMPISILVCSILFLIFIFNLENVEKGFSLICVIYFLLLLIGIQHLMYFAADGEMWFCFPSVVGWGKAILFSVLYCIGVAIYYVMVTMVLRYILEREIIFSKGLLFLGVLVMTCLLTKDLGHVPYLLIFFSVILLIAVFVISQDFLNGIIAIPLILIGGCGIWFFIVSYWQLAVGILFFAILGHATPAMVSAEEMEARRKEGWEQERSNIEGEIVHCRQWEHGSQRECKLNDLNSRLEKVNKKIRGF